VKKTLQCFEFEKYNVVFLFGKDLNVSPFDPQAAALANELPRQKNELSRQKAEKRRCDRRLSYSNSRWCV
jgi:hypothetical protein